MISVAMNYEHIFFNPIYHHSHRDKEKTGEKCIEMNAWNVDDVRKRFV